MTTGIERAVLFDADGALVDSRGGCRRVWERPSRLQGLAPEATPAATHGRKPADTITEVAPHLDPVAEYGTQPIRRT